MILDEIVDHKRRELIEAKRRQPLSELRAAAEDLPRRSDYAAALRGDDVRLIAEIKRASPTKGVMRDEVDPVVVAERYVAAGADAISILTDAKYFRGSLDDLIRVAQRFSTPLLRKDFLIDEYQ